MQGVTNSLKDSLNLVVGVGAVRHINMQSDPGVHRKSAPKFLCYAGFIIAAPFLLECGAEHQKRPIGQIQIAPCQALVHRHRKTAVPGNAAKVAQRLAQCLPQHNTGIFYRVMGVYLQVSLHRQLQPKAAVHRKGGKHVIKEAVAGGHGHFPAVQTQGGRNLGLFRISFYRCRSHKPHLLFKPYFYRVGVGGQALRLCQKHNIVLGLFQLFRGVINKG